MSGTPATPDPAADPQASPPNTPPAPAGNPGAGDGPSFTQAQLDSYLANERRKWEDKAKRDADAVRAKAEEDALADQQKHKELADKRAERIVQLEAEATTAQSLKDEKERLSAALGTYVDALKEHATDAMKDACEGRDLPWQIEFLSKHLGATGKPTNGIPATVRANGTVGQNPAQDYIARTYAFPKQNQAT